MEFYSKTSFTRAKWIVIFTQKSVFKLYKKFKNVYHTKTVKPIKIPRSENLK